MANNVQITPGSGATIETIDQGAGVERQVFVLGSIGSAASGEKQLTAGQKTAINSIPVVLASDHSTLNVALAPSATTTYGITPGSSTVLESGHILKASAGNLYSLYVTTSYDAGFLMTFNSTTIPANGVVTPVECFLVPAYSTGSLDFSSIPDFYSTGITVAFSTTGPFTKTASATCFFKWRVK